MVQKVKEEMSQIAVDANKRKMEETKLEEVKKEIEDKKELMKKYQSKLDKKKKERDEKSIERNRHKKFHTFLTSVISEKDGENKDYQDIEELQNRFHLLRKENTKLEGAKEKVSKEIERLQKEEVDTLKDLQAKLYDAQSKM